MKPTQLSERLWEFAAHVGKLVDALPDTRLGRHVAAQLVHCGTSPGPHYDEGCAAESRADFADKLGIVLKELVETSGWLRFTVKSGLLTPSKVIGLLDEAGRLETIVTSSRQSAQATGRPVSSPVSTRETSISDHGFRGLDHLAIVVPNTDEALAIWQDRLGLKPLFSEVVNDGAVRLTHLDLGNTQLQLVEPLVPDHPLKEWLARNGPGLHHFCLRVDDVVGAGVELSRAGLPVAGNAHQGAQGRRALFLEQSATQGVRVEVTGR